MGANKIMSDVTHDCFNRFKASGATDKGAAFYCLLAFCEGLKNAGFERKNEKRSDMIKRILEN